MSELVGKFIRMENGDILYVRELLSNGKLLLSEGKAKEQDKILHRVPLGLVSMVYSEKDLADALKWECVSNCFRRAGFTEPEHALEALNSDFLCYLINLCKDKEGPWDDNLSDEEKLNYIKEDFNNNFL